MLEIQLLGGFQVREDAWTLGGIDSPRLQSLLARLVLYPGMPQPRRQLSFLYWPDSTEQQARTNLRQLIYKLRLALPEFERYVFDGGQALTWRADAPYTLDVVEFKRAAEQPT